MLTEKEKILAEIAIVETQRDVTIEEDGFITDWEAAEFEAHLNDLRRNLRELETPALL